MKQIIRLSLILMVVAVAFSSCSKVVVVADVPVDGSWVLTDASGRDANGWYAITTGMEGGVFHLYSDGSAAYEDGNIVMHGNWYTSVTENGYYDEYGNYYSNSHESMGINLSDGAGNSANIYFDDISVGNNTLTGTVYDGHTLEKYHFTRY